MSNIDWDFIHNTPIEQKIYAPWARRSWEAFKAFIPPRSKILEIGCGSGKNVAFAAKELGCDATGIDVNEKGLAYAREVARLLQVDITIKKDDGFALSFEDDSFDVVLSEGVIEHFPYECIMQMVSEHVRVCRKGGRVLISTPNTFNLPYTIGRAIYRDKLPFWPERSFSLFSLARLMSSPGLKIIGRSGFSPTSGFVPFLKTTSGKIPYIERLVRLVQRTGVDKIQNQMLLALIGSQVLVAGVK
jgi:SAM-dependent methyltransferase